MGLLPFCLRESSNYDSIRLLEEFYDKEAKRNYQRKEKRSKKVAKIIGID